MLHVHIYLWQGEVCLRRVAGFRVGFCSPRPGSSFRALAREPVQNVKEDEFVVSHTLAIYVREDEFVVSHTFAFYLY